MRRATRRAAFLVPVVVAGCASSPTPEPGKAETGKTPAVESRHVETAKAIRAHLEATTPEERKRTLAALDAYPVPKDAAERARLLREALARPVREGALRHSDPQGEPRAEVFIATPAGYDPKNDYPTLIGFSAYCNDAAYSLAPFAAPRVPDAPPEEKKATPSIPWEDGLVLAPCIPDIAEFNSATYVPARQRVLAMIARANRTFAVDPDRLVAVGYSLGSTMAYDMAARYPDRFAAIADVSGGCPRHPTPLQNLKYLGVHVSHGEKDDLVPIQVAYDIEAFLKNNQIPHELEIVKDGEHSWPQTPEHGQRIRTFLRAKKRDAWPRKLVDLVLVPSTEPLYRVYWLAVPPSEEKRAVSATVADNVITFTGQKGLAKVTLFLGEPLVDLDREVVVRWESKKSKKELFLGKLARSLATLAADLEADGFDTVRAAPARIEVELPRD